MITKTGTHRKGKITLTDIIQTTKQSKNYGMTGAITIFVGTVRMRTPSKENVEKLEIEAYEEKANKTLQNICKELNRKPGITDVQIHHLIGTFKPGEELVYVLVAGTHRDAVFPILQEAVERYKKETPIFKKEYVATKRGKTRAYWTSEQKANMNNPKKNRKP